MILLRVVPTVILTGGLHAAKSMGLRAAKSWLLANMLCKFRGLHAAKSWSGSLRNLHIDTLDLNFGKPTMRTRITKCLSLFVRPRWIQQHLHVKPLTWPFKLPTSDHVADVAEDCIEGEEAAEGPEAGEVVEAGVLVASRAQVCSQPHHHLHQEGENSAVQGCRCTAPAGGRGCSKWWWSRSAWGTSGT